MDLSVLDSLDKLSKRLDSLEAPPVVKFKRLHPDAVVPKYQHPGDAGMDLTAIKNAVVMPEAVVCIPTGFAISLPPGYEAQVRSRSGLSIRGVVVANSPGTIDSMYSGEVKVIVRNHGELFTIHKGDRIAQLVIARVAQAQIVEVAELPETERGAGGFGSTGK
jgi:dUTP pyrophosphatase